MTGMEVTATFGDGGSTTGFWATTGATAGAASAAGWNLSLDGDTFTADWNFTYTNRSLTNLFIDAGAGDTVFDVINSPSLSPGSSIGREIELSVDSPWDINATYSGQVAVGGTVYGDLYRYLSLDFTEYVGTTGNLVSFRADTDNLVFPLEPNPVPEPTTMILFGTGIAGLAAIRRRKTKK